MNDNRETVQVPTNAVLKKYRLLLSREQVFTIEVEARDEDVAYKIARSIEQQVMSKAEPCSEDIGWHRLNLFNGCIQGVHYGELEAFDVEEAD